MTKKPTEAAPGQLVIPSYLEELVPEAEYQGLGANSRISLESLVDRLNPTIRFGREPNRRDYANAEVDRLNSGLFVLPNDKKYEDLATLVRLGVNRMSSLQADGSDDKRFSAVAFQPVEFPVVARSAVDLGRHMQNRTRRARWERSNRQETSDASRRAAGHVMEDKIAAQNGLEQRLTADNGRYRKLIEHLRNPSEVRMRVSRLDKERAYAVEKVHETIELAAIYFDYDNVAVAGLHKAAKRLIYNGNFSHALRSHNLIKYISMVGVHNKAKMFKLDLSRKACKRELAKHQPFLDAEEARKREEQAQQVA